MRILILIGILILLAGCEAVQLPNKYYCEKDSDCVVKDVHNCCGYYPRCVNMAHKPDIEAVERECREKGLMGICGFPDITHCKCINNTCKSMQNEDIV